MKALLKVIFCIYLIILVKLILFKGSLFFKIVPTSTEYIQDSRSKNIDSYNLIPFRSIFKYLTGNVTNKEFFFNIFGNILLFVPLGFLLPIIWGKAKHPGIIAIASGFLSLLFELYQLVTNTGQFDVDDIILNLMGGITGYLLYSFIRNKVSKAQYKAEITR